MCEFLDQNGKALEVGDEVEYWSSSSKDWIKASVGEIDSIREMGHVKNEAGDYDRVPVTNIKIFVSPMQSNGHYRHYHPIRLTKSENVRKI